MKKKLLALICALALVFSLVGCTISAPDTVGSIGDFEITSGMYLLAQYGAYQQAAQLAGTDKTGSAVHIRSGNSPVSVKIQQPLIRALAPVNVGCVLL